MIVNNYERVEYFPYTDEGFSKAVAAREQMEREHAQHGGVPNPWR